MDMRYRFDIRIRIASCNRNKHF